MISKLNKNHNPAGFTVVELLIVIVIIGILAAITITSYSGITQRANEASLKSDLQNAIKRLALDNVETGKYPANLGDANGGKGLSKSPNTSYQYGSIETEYCLTATSINNSSQVFHVDSNSGGIMSGPCTTELNPSLAWKQISSNSSYSCGITINGTGYCWGNAYSSGRLGDNTATTRAVPTPIYASGALLGKTLKAIDTGDRHACAIASDDRAYCWGDNGGGQLGDNSTINRNAPVAVNTSGALNGKTVKSLALGDNHTCVIASDNKVYCWGYNFNGNLGDGTNTGKQVPTIINYSGLLNGLDALQLSSGNGTTCLLASDNNVYCWGYNEYGQLGNNSTTNSNIAVAVHRTGALNGKTIKQLVNGLASSCAIASDNNAYCWGANWFGQLGNNSTTNSLVPVGVFNSGALNGLTIRSIDTLSETCVIASNNKVYCWGDNYYGSLGNGTVNDSLVPTAVDTSGVLNNLSIKSVSSGRSQTCALASDNRCHCWGSRDLDYYDSRGILGDNRTGGSLNPVTVSPIGTAGIDLSSVF